MRVCTDLYSQLCLTPCDPMDYIGARQTPLCMEFSRQEYWRGLPFSFPWDLPSPGIESSFLASPALQAESSSVEPPGKPRIVVPSPLKLLQR